MMAQSGELRTLSKEYLVEGSGETTEAALQAAFKVLRSEVMKDVGSFVVYMEPEEVAVLSSEKATRTERFLLVFWPRQRTTYTIKFRIKVLVKIVDFSGVTVRDTTVSSQDAGEFGAFRKLFPGRK